ncbi:hypothetical protein ACS0TY_004960 [Phlomoides rotata]
MAFAVLFSLAQTADQILNDDRYPLSVDGKQQIKSIRNQATFLQEFLENHPKESHNLERRIRDAANEAQDIIEHFMYEQIRSRYKLIRSAAAGITGVNSDHRYDFHELKRVDLEINSIAEEVMGIKIGDLGLGDSPPATNSTAGDNILVGFDEDLITIKDMLCGSSSKLQVIPIAGMGGIGKTTLARNIYCSQLIMDHFDNRAWVTVSQDCVTQNVLSKIIDSIGIDSDRLEHSIELGEKLYKILKGRRYLIVLDDIWSTDAWDDLRRIFPDDGNGSRIMITTRLFDVASYANSSSRVYEMPFLDPDESWNLLGQKVFKRQNFPLELEKLGEETANELEKIGREIARSCGGLPLAIVLIAGLLSSVSKTKASWKGITDKVRPAVATKDGQFEKIISLSYTYLPHHLRLCFLYMGCFPEDCKIRVSKLVKLWIAEGSVKLCLSKSFEEDAEKYVEDLVKRSLVLVTSRKTNGKIKTCSLHNMVRELSRRRAEDENFKRRLSIAHSDLKHVSKSYGSTIRSIICFQHSETSLGFLRKFRLLRVLDVVDVFIYSLPAQVFELFHLRYLAFGCPMKIPAAISMLQNLSTLVIWPRKGSRHYSMDEVYLPMEIWMMPLLRHLVSFFDLLPDPEGATFALENLHTLSVVKRFECSETMLGRIPNLKKLGVTYFGGIYSENSQLNNLVFLHQLETLKLIRNGDSPVQLSVYPVFPASLKKLTLSGWHFPWEFMKNVGSLPSLEVLKLRDYACKGEEWETSDDEFVCLKYLLIDRSDLQSWITDSSHFPRLERLVLYCCLLTEIPDGVGDIPTLQLVEIDQANKSLVESAKMVQEEQQSYGNDDLQVRSVRYHYQIRFTYEDSNL